jgi:hypothetical protein
MVKKFNDCLTKKFPRLKTMKKTDLYLIALMIIISLAIFILVFKDILSFELKHAYCWDNPLYWTVGRGILNGLTPYAQLYENKPPGIFLFAALSFALTNDAIIGNIISCLSALVITVIISSTASAGTTVWLRMFYDNVNIRRLCCFSTKQIFPKAELAPRAPWSGGYFITISSAKL